MNARPVIVTCALTGSAPTPAKHAAVPVTPAEIAASAAAAAEAGAAIVHVHVRDPLTGQPSSALSHYREVVERVRAARPTLILNLTTGPGGRFVPGTVDPGTGGDGTTLRAPAERVAHVLALRPELCSLDVATMNRARYALVNVPAHLEAMARAIVAAGVTPELEVFDGGHLELALDLIRRVPLPSPPWVQFCLGVPWGLPATLDALVYLRGRLPPDVPWSAFGTGPESLRVAALATVAGGHVRVGFEDNLYLRRGELAPSNAALVEQAVRLIETLGERVATPAEARAMLGLEARAAVAAGARRA